MAKDYPEFVALKNRKCPQCGSKDFGHPDLKPLEAAVMAACKTKDCDFKLDLFWIGDMGDAWSN